MIASIAHKINKLQAWEIRRRLARSNRDHQKKRSLHLAFRHSKRAASLSNAEVYMDEESATHVEAEAHFGELDSAQAVFMPFGLSFWIFRHSYCINHLQLPFIHVGCPLRLIEYKRTDVNAMHNSSRQVQLRDSFTGTIKSYPLYHDAELGLGDLGYAMDVEMAAVPTNCREDDDAQTTSEVLALGVDTVEQYLSSLLLTADRYLERAKSQRMEKIRERILRP
ncbi:hypothetical protein cyc_04430 [Cyclospora cayetanensis]|uniref:Uncharacterized protein n=1 Tax=Cyclospora cayetanensis TaxID=88456 RepID=A0A1D3CR32_9EIME|nr:hypothetical protein cyc_04430 [Cyclospora cayetanensis]